MADTFARMKQLVGTTAEWAANDIVLGEGEIGVERIGVSDHRAKCGDGVKTWSQLPYLSGTAAAVDAQVAAASAHAVTATTQAGIATTKASEASVSQSAAAASQSAASGSAANAANSAAIALDAADDAAAFAGFRDFASLSTLLANTTLTYSGSTSNTVQVNQIIRIRDTGEAYEVAASGATDHHVTTAGGVNGGVKLYWVPASIESPETGRAVSALDVAHYNKQGSSPNLSQIMIAGHDYTDASRGVQIDKVGGSIASASYVMGLRRGSNHIRRDDKDGTYVAGCGFLRCSYDRFDDSSSFTGSISGNVLTVSAVASGTITAGQFITWSGTDNGTTIVSQTSGTPAGGVGTYTVALRGTTAGSQTVTSQTMTGKTKVEVLAFYIGTTGDFGWSTDRATFTTGYNGGFYAYDFKAGTGAQYIASYSAGTAQVLNIQDSISGTRTDIIAPSNQTSGMRIEAAGGGIDIAPKSGSPITVRGNINSQSGSDLAITAVNSRLDLNGTNGVRSLAPLRPGIYNVSSLSSLAASSYLGYIVFVSDGDTGSTPCLAVSDGTNWRRISLGTAI